MKLRIPAALFFLLVSMLHSQEMKLYAPFPSRIKAETAGTEIHISWKDSGDVTDAAYEIYRAETALTADNLYLAEKIGETASGVETFRDKPSPGVDLYYAVFVRDSAQVYKICIPYRNVTTSSVSVEESDIEESRSAIISNLEAAVFEEDVSLSYNSSLSDRSIILFRNTSVIDAYEKLIKSVIIREERGSESAFIDNPMAGLNYFYAAVDADLYRSGSRNLLYKGNYTENPVHIKFSHELSEDNRYVKSAMPLPLLKITAELESGKSLEKTPEREYPDGLSEETLRIVGRMSEKSIRPYAPLEKVTLAYNKNINSIVTSFFAGNRWAECAESLEPYTSFQYDEDTRMQSHFYRGQSYYHMGLYNKALVEFIMVEQAFYAETKPFVNALFEMKREEQQGL